MCLCGRDFIYIFRGFSLDGVKDRITSGNHRWPECCERAEQGVHIIIFNREECPSAVKRCHHACRKSAGMEKRHDVKNAISRTVIHHSGHAADTGQHQTMGKRDRLAVAGRSRCGKNNEHILFAEVFRLYRGQARLTGQPYLSGNCGIVVHNIKHGNLQPGRRFACGGGQGAFQCEGPDLFILKM